MYREPAYRWRDPEWRSAAEAWIREQASRAGREITGAITDVRFLPWSAVLRAPSASGDLYFKACGPSQHHEPSLAAFLAAARPDCMIPVVASDVTRGWYLMPDGGATLTTALQNPRDEFDHWARVLRLQAGVQRDLLPQSEHLLALDVPDRRPAALAGYLTQLLEQPDILLVGHPGGMTAGEVEELRRSTPRLEDLCYELASLGPPDTFVHDDFHEDHIFTAPQPSGSWRYIFFDFGDACVSHPFVQLVSQPRFAGNRFGSEADPIQTQLREIYLADWRDFAAAAALERAAALALVAGCVVRALTWVNACRDHLDELPLDLRHAYATRLAFWLGQVYERMARLAAS